VTLNIDGVLYLRVRDAYKASYGVEDPEFAITQLAQTTMRSEIGKITLDTLFRERDNLNTAIVIAINQASEDWGIQCMRYEIRDIRMPSRVQEAMQMQVEAERKKRAAILESEGIKTAEINIAEGKKQSKILQSGTYYGQETARELMTKICCMLQRLRNNSSLTRRKVQPRPSLPQDELELSPSRWSQRL
jgi:regulator of protease activity HflC (stomatin/prohibitin superfamily)